MATVELLLPLKSQFNIDDNKAEAFLKAYKSVGGDYKHLRTVASGDNEPTWDIVRNSVLNKLIQIINDENPSLWENDLPTKEHVELIIWAYSPEASKIKKGLSKLEEKLGQNEESNDEEQLNENSDEEHVEKGSKRRSTSSSSDEDEESPKKKSKK